MIAELRPDWMAAAAGVAVGSSWVGWGGIVSRLTRVRAAWPEKAVLGVSLLVVVCGVLERAGMLSRQFYVAWTVVGLLAWIPALRSVRPALRNPFRFHPTLDGRARWGLAALALLTAALFVLSARSTGRYNLYDDGPAYCVFPEKVLQTGKLGEDPFSERRIVTSLGGKPTLDALALALAGSGRSHMLDTGIGLTCAIALLLLYCARIGVGPIAAIGIALPLLIFATSTSNSTSWNLPVACIIFLVARYPSRVGDSRHPGEILCAALVVASLCALKSNLAIAVGIYLGALVTHAILIRDARQLASAITVGALACVLLLPWMIALREAGGTYFFPLLGRGYHVTAYGLSSVTRWSWADKLSPVVLHDLLSNRGLWIVGVAWILALRCDIRPVALRWAAPTAVVAATVITSVLTGGYDGARYTQSYTMPVTLMLLMHLSLPVSDLLRRNLVVRRIFQVVICATFFTAAVQPYAKELYRRALVNVTQAARPYPVTAFIVDRYRAAQLSVPSGERILASADHASALDFRRNPIWIADYPGSAGLPPGFPQEESVERWTAYLRSAGIRYVMVTRGGIYDRMRSYDEVGDPDTTIRSPWVHQEFVLAKRYLRHFDEAAKTMEHYNTDGIVIIDLHKGGGVR